MNPGLSPSQFQLKRRVDCSHSAVALAFAQRWVSTFCSSVLTTINVLVAGKPLKFHFCDPSRGRRKRRQAALKLDGFVYHTFSGSIESECDFLLFSTANSNDGRYFFAGLGAVNNTATISTSAPKDEPEAERERPSSQGNSESVGTRSEPLDGAVVDRIWHDNSQPIDDASQPVDDAIPATAAAAASAAPTTVAVESDSNYESDFMNFINWPEE